MEDFWFIVAVRSEDETEISGGQSDGRTSIESHSAPDTPALFGRRKDPHRAGGVAGRGEHLRAVPSEGIAASIYYDWSKELLEAGKRRLGRRHGACCDLQQDLRQGAAALKELVADLTLENRLLKKSINGDGEARPPSRRVPGCPMKSPGRQGPKSDWVVCIPAHLGRPLSGSRLVLLRSKSSE
jgi:transposase